MEEIKHLPEIVFNWVATISGTIFAFIIAWLIRLQFLESKNEKGLALNETNDMMRDKEIKEIKDSIKEFKSEFKSEFNTLKMANNTTLARVNLMIEKMK